MICDSASSEEVVAGVAACSISVEIRAVTVGSQGCVATNVGTAAVAKSYVCVKFSGV